MMTFRSSLLLFLFSLLLLSSCGNRPAQARACGPDATAKPEAVPTQTPRRLPPSEVPADRVAFQKIAFSPELIYATTDAFLNVAVTTQEVSGIKLFYSFWVNRRLVRESEENALPHKFFKKGDLLYADVVVLKEGKEIARRRSEAIQVLDSPPRFTRLEVPKIQGFGDYTIPVEAFDDDGDKITFALQGENLPEGLSIDSQTGTILFAFHKEPAERVVFSVVADDGQERSSQEVTLLFRQVKGETPAAPVQDKKEESKPSSPQETPPQTPDQPSR